MRNIQSIRKTRRSPKSTEHECVTSNQQQLQTCVLQKEEEKKSLKDTRNEDITKDTDISKELSNSADTSFTSDISAQTEISICSWQENNEKLFNLPCNVTKNSMSPLSMISDDRTMIHADRFAGELSKNHVKQTFLANKIKKYKKCSCREQCPYALYKLPCNNKFKRSTPEKKVDDEINGLTLECLSFQRKNNLPTFINVDMTQEKNDKCFTDVSPFKIGIDESSTSSLSIDLEVKICNDHHNLENIDEFSKRRRARTYIVNKKSTRKNNLIKSFRNETESTFNIISLWRYINEKKEKIDEIIENILSQRKYINYPEQNHQKHKKYKRENFDSHWSLKNKNKQIQCAIPVPITPMSNKKISVKTSNPKFQQSNSLNPSRRRTSLRRSNFPKRITPKWMKTHTQMQTGKCSYFNYLENNLSFLNDNANVKNENGEKNMTKNNTCVIETMDVLASQIMWPRIKKSHNIYSALQTRSVNSCSKDSLSQACDLTDDWRNRSKALTVKTSCPLFCNHISAEKRKNLMSYLTNYSRFPTKTLNFDMTNVSDRLYDCLEKLEDITA